MVIEDLKVGDWVQGVVGTSDIWGPIVSIDEHSAVVDGGFVPYPASIAQKGGTYQLPLAHIYNRFNAQPEFWQPDTNEVRRAYYKNEDRVFKEQYGKGRTR